MCAVIILFCERCFLRVTYRCTEAFKLVVNTLSNRAYYNRYIMNYNEEKIVTNFKVRQF